jgi:hypothetical protein
MSINWHFIGVESEEDSALEFCQIGNSCDGDGTGQMWNLGDGYSGYSGSGITDGSEYYYGDSNGGGWGYGGNNEKWGSYGDGWGDGESHA